MTIQGTGRPRRLCTKQILHLPEDDVMKPRSSLLRPTSKHWDQTRKKKKKDVETRDETKDEHERWKKKACWCVGTFLTRFIWKLDAVQQLVWFIKIQWYYHSTVRKRLRLVSLLLNRDVTGQRIEFIKQVTGFEYLMLKSSIFQWSSPLNFVLKNTSHSHNSQIKRSQWWSCWRGIHCLMNSSIQSNRGAASVHAFLLFIALRGTNTLTLTDESPARLPQLHTFFHLSRKSSLWGPSAPSQSVFFRAGGHLFQSEQHSLCRSA